MQKYFFILCFQLACFFCSAQQFPLNACDGPYVLYQNSHIVIKSINAASAPEIEAFNVSEKTKHPISIHFSNHTGWDFTVRLRDSILYEPDHFKAPKKVFALSDIEGEFEAFRGLLISAGVMDSAYHWTFGKNALVICGDLFDRGQDVAAELWLLYKLEDEARAVGGYVHSILGNHDIMNMSGDLRYLQPKYFEHAKIMGQDYMDLYAANTELGRWLRSKNIIEKIGDNLYLHGGVSPQMLLAIDTLNYRFRPLYDKTKHAESYYPFWYRGYFMEPRATESFIDSTLAFYHVSRIIVGHTITDSNIASYYEGKVIGLDVNEHEGHSEAIVIEKNKIYTTDLTGKKKPIGEGPANPVVQ